MTMTNVFAIGITTVICFLTGFIWYGVLFGDLYLDLLGTGASAPLNTSPQIAVTLGELLRCAAMTIAFAYFISRLCTANIASALGLAVISRFGLQAVTLSGAVLHEGYPPALFALHAGDALTKSILICVIQTI